jgi:hypothetical protein
VPPLGAPGPATKQQRQPPSNHNGRGLPGPSPSLDQARVVAAALVPLQVSSTAASIVLYFTYLMLYMLLLFLTKLVKVLIILQTIEVKITPEIQFGSRVRMNPLPNNHILKC